MIQEPR